MVVFVALAALFLDAVRHVTRSWAVLLRASRRYPRGKRPLTHSGFWLAEAMQFPYPAAPVDEANRYRRNAMWFVGEIAAFAALILIAAIVHSV